MLVSLKWLSKYVDLPMSTEELELRLALSGLNHEGTDTINGDTVVDLEVTSNRGDCLGHIGVAREVSVLYGLPLNIPDPKTGVPHEPSGTGDVRSLLSVENRNLAACPRYTARVIQGVQVGPSPDWLVESLQSVFWKRKKDGSLEHFQSVNNVVDATNYVLMECGQPLHAFDYAKVADAKIIVRAAEQGETMQAIDHKEYDLDESMCVIADANEASAVAGVMGGAKSEVSESTTDLVIESAIFTPLSIRRTARTLKLHSPSSYRFERKVDPIGVDWASRRVCDIITDLAGGTVAEGVIDTAPDIPAREPIVLRLSELERILGIKIDADEVSRILGALGCDRHGQDDQTATYVPPSWRHDLTRPADLIEEVARIHGYDKIPEDAPIPVAPSSKRTFDTALDRLRTVLTAGGLSEAMTPSVVTKKIDELVSPWSSISALETDTPMLKGARRLRRTIIPSLLEARAKNWASASIEANLFEIAHLYLPADGNPADSAEALPTEQYSLAVVSGADFFDVKGLLQTLVERMGIATTMTIETAQRDGFLAGGCVSMMIGDQLLGYIGKIAPAVLKSLKLPGEVVAAELSLPALLEHAELVPQQSAISQFPSVQRDLNFIVAEQVRWSEMEKVVRAAVGTELAGVTYRETYRDAAKDGKETKRVLMTVELQRHDGTLSGEQADQMIGKVIDACGKELSARLLS